MIPRLQDQATPQRPVNEFNRHVIALRDVDADRPAERHLVAVTVTATPHEVVIEAVLGARQQVCGVPSGWASAIVDELCSGRAAMTVDGSVLVQGRRIAPQRYLDLWDQAIATPITPSQFERAYGIELRASYRFHADLIPGVRTGSTARAFRTLSEVMHALGDNVTRTHSGYVNAAAALANPDALEIALCLDDCLAEYRLPKGAAVWGQLIFERAAKVTEPELFQEAA